MTRRKPISTKQRKAELQLKRAIKRGDIDPLPPADRNNRKRNRQPGRSADAGEGSGISVKKLESNFRKLDKEWLEHAKLIASTTALQRPIPQSMAILDTFRDEDNSEGSKRKQLTCPRRPKWRYDQTKKEVEKNEEGIFSKWLKETEEIIQQWQNEPIIDAASEDVAQVAFKRSPTYFERNLEVWRQL